MKNNKYNISVIGSGVVGQATGKGLISRGHDVSFIDINREKIQKLKESGFNAYTIDQVKQENIRSDISLLTVSTPTENGRINLEYLKQASIDLGARLRKSSKYHLVVVRSTVLPGTTEDVVQKNIEEYSGKKAGIDFGLCMNPEYLREISAENDFSNPWIIVIGEYDKKSGDILSDMYRDFNCHIERVSIKEAELQKYIHNLFNANKISFFNEFRKISSNIGIDPNRVFALVAKSCEGMWNANYGIKDKGPFSGMCLPKDTQAYLTWANEHGYDMPLLNATITVNELVKNNSKFKSNQISFNKEIDISKRKSNNDLLTILIKSVIQANEANVDTKVVNELLKTTLKINEAIKNDLYQKRSNGNNKYVSAYSLDIKSKYTKSKKRNSKNINV